MWRELGHLDMESMMEGMGMSELGCGLVCRERDAGTPEESRRGFNLQLKMANRDSSGV